MLPSTHEVPIIVTPHMTTPSPSSTPTARLAFIASIACLAATAMASLPTPCSAADRAPTQIVQNSLGMRFVRIPAGSFMMGSDETPEALARDFPAYSRDRFEQLSDEAPVHRVRITRPFYLGQHEVTVGQFERFLALSGHVPESIADGTGGYGYNPDYDPARSPRGDAFEGRDPRYSWRNPGFAQGQDHPVVNVTWNDAMALARWLSRREHVRYRLPTEAEWEYACKAGGRTRYQGSDDPQSLVRSGATFDQDTAPPWPQWRDYALAGHDGHAFTAPVGSFAPNAFGVHDMHGNAWEWTADWYGENYYAHSPARDPRGPADGNARVRRGGSWHTWALYARCTYRNFNTPSTRYTLVGIRLVREVRELHEVHEVRSTSRTQAPALPQTASK